jgi:hypothetical protein
LRCLDGSPAIRTLIAMSVEDDFVRAQRRIKIRNAVLLVGIVGSLLLAFPIMIGFVGGSGLGGGYVLAPLPLLACYGIVRAFFTKGRG